MKILGVKTTLFREPRFDGAHRSGATHALLELSTGTGLTGVAVTRAAAVPAVNALVRDLLKGADPRATMGLWERMRAAGSDDDDLAAVRARAALDIALWDLKAKANGEPLWKALGGNRPRAKVHLGWDGSADTGSMVDWFRRMSGETGIRCGSMPAGADPRGDLEIMAGMQSALRATVPQSALMLHFPGTGRPGDAIGHVRTLESRFDLTWVRSPVRPADFRGARRIADGVAAAVCIGRGLSEISDYRPYLEHYAANVVELDIAILGISGSIQMADAAFGHELPVALSAHAGHLPVQLFSALPTSMSCEIGFRACLSEVCSGDLTFDDGRAVAGDRHGNGLLIDRDALAAAAVDGDRT